MTLERIFNFLFLLLLPSLVVSFAANSIVLVSLWVISVFLIRNGYTKDFFKNYLLFSAFFISILIGTFLDLGNDMGYDSRHLIKRAAFLLMPFVMYHAKQNYQRLSLQVFVYFLSVMSFILILAGFVRSVLNRNEILYGIWDSETTEAFYKQDMLINWGELSYKRLFYMLDMHPSYYAFFSATAILILLFTSLIEIKKPLKWMLLGLHTFMILLLSSKAGMASLLIIFIAGLLSKSSVKQKRATAIVFLALILLGLSLPATQLRLKQAYLSFTSDKHETALNSSAERIALWRSIEDFNTHELLVGSGIQSSRAKIFLLTGIDKNMHNQYLQAVIDSGIAGFILLIIFLILPQFYNRSAFINIFIGILLLNLLFENMLDRAWGIVFVTFFYGLFIFGDLRFSDEKSAKIEN